MEKNRKILLALFMFVLLSVLLSFMQIYITMNKEGGVTISAPSGAPGVSIVRLYGPISMVGQQSAFGGITGAEALIAQLDRIENDDRVKAVVLRIDSPGGTVAATQEIFSKLMTLRQKNKILVASMGDLAASGGYYAASACNHIMANQGTITASIGVIAAAPNLKGLFEKLGIKMNVIKSGLYKDILSSSRDMTEDEKKLLQSMIDGSYLQFIKDISLGRNIPIDDIRPIADGRIMNGQTALESKLIDSLGTFENAIAKAKSLAKLPEDAPVYEEKVSPIEEFLGMVSSKTNMNPLSSLVISQPVMPIEYRYVP